MHKKQVRRFILILFTLIIVFFLISHTAFADFHLVDQSDTTTENIVEKEQQKNDTDEELKYEYSNQKYKTRQKKFILHDTPIISPSLNVEIGHTVVPEGWTMAVEELSLSTESLTCPIAVLVRVISPENDCELLYISRREFKQITTSFNGIETLSADDEYDPETMYHMLNYRNAWECCDYIAQQEYNIAATGTDVSFLKEEQQLLTQALDDYSAAIEQVMYTAMENGIVTESYLGSQYGFVQCQYQDTDSEVAICTGSCGYELYQDDNGAISDSIIWCMPCVFGIRAPSFDKYQELFDVFRSITCMSKEFIQMRQLTTQRLIQEYILLENDMGHLSIQEDGGYSDIQQQTVKQQCSYENNKGWDAYLYDNDDSYTTGHIKHLKLYPDYEYLFEVKETYINGAGEKDSKNGGITLVPSEIKEEQN